MKDKNEKSSVYIKENSKKITIYMYITVLAFITMFALDAVILKIIMAVIMAIGMVKLGIFIKNVIKLQKMEIEN